MTTELGDPSCEHRAVPYMGSCSLCAPPDNTARLIMEEDPYGKGQHESGAKLDAGKPDLSLLLMFGRALEAVGQVGTFGAEKYTRGGWQAVDDGYERYTAALLRHLCKEHYGQLDSDSGLLHSAHAAWNALARLELILREEESDGTPDTTGR